MEEQQKVPAKVIPVDLEKEMKKSRVAKALGALAVSAALALGCAGTALAGGGSWQRSGSDWWYAYDGGGYAASGWERVGGEWYLFDGGGWMETGWQRVGGTWYYLKASGAMAEGWAHDGSAWYWLEPGSGAMATGRKSLGGTWYYLTGSGAMAEGWQSVGGEWYYLEPGSGAMATGWKSVYEQQWVEDEPAWDEEVWEWKIVCRCGYVTVGSTGDEMAADWNRHVDQTDAEYEAGLRDKRCGGSVTKQVQTGTIHHDATGHYEQVKTGEKCACGATR